MIWLVVCSVAATSFIFLFTNLSRILVPSLNGEWSVSPYPNGYEFAFTIIHDADDAYSERLAPLFDVFDEYGYKITTTVFAFWGQDAESKWIYETTPPYERFYKAKAVPLEVESEKIFYKRLESRGHEIGLHSASNLSDTREDTEKAFKYFRSVFGHYPKIYVEHRDIDNKECLQREGSNPQSKYYVVDILNRYEPWVWVISPSSLPYEGKGNYFNILDQSPSLFSDTALKYWGILKGLLKTRRIKLEDGDLYLSMVKRGSPFDEYVLKRFGIINGFRRTGKKENANGDGFLQWYSRENIDKLEKQRGTALVYTHLNSKWLDRRDRKMRDDIKDRLEYIASKNVWLAPAGEILDRFKDISNVHLYYDDNYVTIINSSHKVIQNLTLISKNMKGLKPIKPKRQIHSKKDMIIIGDIAPGETLIFNICG